MSGWPEYMSHDINGKEYVRLSSLKGGEIIIADDNFECVPAGPNLVEVDEEGLFVECKHGTHYLEGQCDDGDHIIGFYKDES